MNEIHDKGYWANVSAEELTAALVSIGCIVGLVHGDSDGDVNMTFADLRDAEVMMSLGLDSSGGPGSMYDRATSSCVSLSQMPDASDGEISALINKGWTWQIHPAMTGRRMNWHVHLVLPAADADQITATIHALHHGGAL